MLDGVLLRIALVKNSSMLLIQRNLNTTFILLVFSLMGTIYGLLASIKSLMIFVEGRVKAIEEKRAKRQKLQNMAQSIDHIVLNCETLIYEENEQEKEIMPLSIDVLHQDSTGLISPTNLIKTKKAS
jgi:hypothetical protein